MIHILLSLSLLLLTIAETNAGVCPADEILSPCVCADDVIRCGGTDRYSLKAIFHSVNNHLSDGQKNFSRLFINNTAIVELEENTLYDLTFAAIEIRDARALRHIHSAAFSAASLTVRSFRSENAPLESRPPDYDLFYALSLMANVEDIQLYGTRLSEIPANAFRPVVGTQRKLWRLYIEDANIGRIGANAFQYLDALRQLFLNRSPIDRISGNALHFNGRSEKQLELWLSGTNLDELSFESGALTHLNRPTHLYFTPESRFTFLEESVFQPFLQSNPDNIVVINQLNCDDCRSYWLVRDGVYDRQITALVCANGRPLLSGLNFAKCVESE